MMQIEIDVIEIGLLFDELGWFLFYQEGLCVWLGEDYVDEVVEGLQQCYDVYQQCVWYVWQGY